MSEQSKHKPPLEVWLSQSVIRYWILWTEGLARLSKHKPPLEVWLSQSVIKYWILRTECLARLSKHKPPLEVWLSQFVINCWGTVTYTKNWGLGVYIRHKPPLEMWLSQSVLKCTSSYHDHRVLNYLLVLQPIVGRSSSLIKGSITI